MTSSLFSSSGWVRLAFLLTALPLWAQPLPTAAGPKHPARAPDAKVLATVSRADYGDDPKVFDRLDAEVAAVGFDAAHRLDLERQLTALLTAPATTPAARQAIAERLGRVIGDRPTSRSPALRVLGPWLSDPARQDLARLALDGVPGDTVDDAYLRALRRAQGPARLAVVQSVGTRRIAKAAPALASLLRGPDAALADAAAAALGAIGTPRAFGILTDRKTSVTPAVLTGQLTAAARQPAKVAIVVYRNVAALSTAPQAIRQRAFRSLLSLLPETAPSLILEALQDRDPGRRAVALEALADLTAAGSATPIAQSLPGLDAPTQAAVLAALARRGDNAVLPEVLAAASGPTAEVRLAAIAALGALPGGADSVARLTEAVLAGGEEAKAATQSLSILRGSGVDEAVATGARTGDATRRAVLIRQLGLRGAANEVGFLLSLNTDPSLPVRLAALEALDSLASPDQERALLDWALSASDPAERNRAVRTFLTAALRNPDAVTRSRLLVSELDRGDQAAQLLLLPALPRLANRDTVACAGRLARSADRAVAEAAFAVLARWPDSSAGAVLVTLAQDQETVRSQAIETATRLFERDSGRPDAIRVEALGQLLALSSEPALLRRQLLLLSRADSPRALAAAERLLENPEVTRDVEDTLLAIRSNLAGAPTLTASDRVDHLARMLDGELNTAWSVRSDREVWLQIDLHSARPIRRLTLDRGSQRNDIPDRYEVFVTDDPAEPGAARVAGEGSREQSSIDLPAGIRGRYVIIRNRGTREDGKWSIAELRVD